MFVRTAASINRDEMHLCNHKKMEEISSPNICIAKCSLTPGLLLFVCQKCVLIALFLLHLAAHLFEHDLSKHTHSSSVAQLITHIY